MPPSSEAARTPLRSEPIDPLGDPRWADFVARAAGATAFHHPAWLQLLADQYGYGMTALCVLAEDGGIAAGLPLARIDSRLTGRRLVALPFSDACPPLGAGGDAAAALARALEREHREGGRPVTIHAELRELAGASFGPAYHHHRVALEPDLSAVTERFRKSQVRRGIAKARREGLTVARRTDREALARFYRLHLATRRRLGVPTQPRGFIDRFAGLFDQGLGFVALVERDGEAAAAAVFLTHRETLTYKYGASNERMLSLRPNNLLFMDAIEWGCANGYRTLDLGRTDLDNEGLRAFKLAWGAEERRLVYTALGGGGAGGAGGGRLASAVIRRSPEFVGRAVGALLYRHYG